MYEYSLKDAIVGKIYKVFCFWNKNSEIYKRHKIY
jgi:hypothetical protein